MSAVHWFRGGQWYQVNKVNACVRIYKGDQAQQGYVIERVRDRRLGGRVPGEVCGAAARLLAFLSSYPIVPEHPPCSRIGMVTRLGYAQWLIQSRWKSPESTMVYTRNNPEDA